MIAETLSTARLTLRKPLAGDVPAYTAYCMSDRAGFVGGPFTEAQAFEKYCAMAGHWALRGYGRYVMVHNGAPIGHVGPLGIDAGQPEMTWTLWDGAAEGKGLATEAATAVWDHLRAQDWPEMIIRILPDNAASIAIARRIGATQTDEAAPAWYEGALTFRLRREVPA
ncbi:MAG: GNAT family N-acetyltransferase [Pseudomonadota bacterium]